MSAFALLLGVERTFVGRTENDTFLVESRCDAVALGQTYLLPPLSSGGALVD